MNFFLYPPYSFGNIINILKFKCQQKLYADLVIFMVKVDI